MHLFREVFLLFSLNLLDAILTIIWVRNGIASEGNALMAHFIDMGNLPFLGIKIAIGTFAAIVLLRWGNRRVAKFGVAAALAVYVGVMAIHALTFVEALNHITRAVPAAATLVEYARLSI